MVVQLATILTTTKVTAQGATSFNNSKTSLRYVFSNMKEFNTSTPIYSTTVSNRVQQKFSKEFTNANDTRWTQEGKGYSVRFVANGIVHRAFLTKRGNCASLIRYYGEEGLPADVRHVVKSTYYDYNITLVTEVLHNRSTAYLVTIADKKSWKVIRVQDGEMDTWESHSKG